MKPSKTQYCIKSCPTDDSEQLEILLNKGDLWYGR